MSSAHSGRSHSRSRSHSPRRPRVHSKRVVIANIPYDVTWNKLKQIFRDRVGFTGFLRLMKSNGRPNGMGIMEFKTIEGAEKAIEMMNRFEIGDRKIIVREETLRDQERMAHMEFDGPVGNDPSNQGGIGLGSVAPGPMTAPACAINPSVAAMTTVTPMMLERMGIKGPLTDSLYISNLDYKIDWKRLKDMFKVAGRVIHATVKQDEEGRSRGIAVVRFEHPYEALLAYILFNGQVFNDRPIRVKIDREGAHVQPNLPIFPPTAGGAAAAASFLTHLANKTGNGMNSFQSPSGGNLGASPFLPGVMPQQSEAAAAALAAFLGASSAGSNMPAAANQFGGQFRAPLPPPSQSASGADLLSSFLGQQQQQQSQPSFMPPMMVGMNNPMLVGGQRGNAAVGFPMSGVNSGMNPLSQLMGLQGGMGGAAMGSGTGSPYFSMAPPDRSGVSRDNITPMVGLQQLLMAAAAGGMSQEQIASAALALGLGRDVTGGGPRFSGMEDSGDRYTGRGINGSGKGGPPGGHHDPYSRRPSRGDYNGQQQQQQQSMLSNSASSDGGSQRGFSRHRVGPSSGGSRPTLRHHMVGDQRSDSSRMYMKRPGDGYGN
ncbi:Myelin expression factor 2 [Sparganum proliferum]